MCCLRASPTSCLTHEGCAALLPVAGRNKPLSLPLSGKSGGPSIGLKLAWRVGCAGAVGMGPNLGTRDPRRSPALPRLLFCPANPGASDDFEQRAASSPPGPFPAKQDQTCRSLSELRWKVTLLVIYNLSHVPWSSKNERAHYFSSRQPPCSSDFALAQLGLLISQFLTHGHPFAQDVFTQQQTSGCAVWQPSRLPASMAWTVPVLLEALVAGWTAAILLVALKRLRRCERRGRRARWAKTVPQSPSTTRTRQHASGERPPPAQCRAPSHSPAPS